jgi:hypothetical protein
MNNDDVQEEWDRVRSWGTHLIPESPDAKVNRLAAAGLVQELQAVGIPLISLDELVNVRLRYPAAVPVLLDHARREYPDDGKAAIFYSLTDGGAGEPLLSELIAILHATHGSLEDFSAFALGQAIAQGAARKDLDSLLEVVRAKELGVAREAVIMRIARFRSEKARNAVREYLREGSAPIAAISAARAARLWDLYDEILKYKDTAEYNDTRRSGLHETVRAYERARRKDLARQSL